MTSFFVSVFHQFSNRANDSEEPNKKLFYQKKMLNDTQSNDLISVLLYKYISKGAYDKQEN